MTKTNYSAFSAAYVRAKAREEKQHDPSVLRGARLALPWLLFIASFWTLVGMAIAGLVRS